MLGRSRTGNKGAFVIRRLLALAGVLVVSVSAVAVAVAATTTHSLNTTVKLHKVTSTTPGVIAYKGTVTGTGGTGTTSVQNKLTSATTSTSNSTTKYKHGTLKSFFKVTQKHTTAGWTFTGTGHAVSGTGIYKHVKRTTRLKLTGTAPTDLSKATLHITGKLIY
jgi:hypothetical protein